MLRTLISLCALLAALFFVFRGVQESSAKGQVPTAGNRSPQVYQQLILQRAKALQRKAELAKGQSGEEAMLRVLAELEYGWRLMELLEIDPALEAIPGKEPVGPAYQQQLTFRAEEAVQEAAAEPEESDGKPQLSKAQQELRDKIQHCLAVYAPKCELTVADHNCWEVMHTLIGYGVENHVSVGPQRYNAIGYLCYNGKCQGFHLFETAGGRLRARQGYGVQGHHGQFLAMLAQHRVSPEYQIKVNGREFTIHNLIEFEKQGCVPKAELTFKLIALVHYLPSDEVWTNRYGQWSIPRLIREELAQPVIGSACGGTHRLMGLSYAVRYRQMRDEPLEGEWRRAADYLDDYQDYAFSLQNHNGSFSTRWFEGRADNGDTQRYQETTGHIVEWLAFSLPEEQLHDPRMVAAVNFLADLMLRNQNYPWTIGPRGHAIRALALYHERAFGEKASVDLASAG